MKQHTQTSPRSQGRTVALGGLAMSAAAMLLLASASTANAGALDRAGISGMLKLGYVSDDRPFSYTDSAGQPAGYAEDGAADQRGFQHGGSIHWLPPVRES